MPRLKVGNKTIATISIIWMLFLFVLTLISFGVIKSDVLTYSTFAGVIALATGIILIMEIFFEGKKPNIQKDMGALIGLIVSIFAIVSGFLMIFSVTIPSWLMGIQGVVYLVAFVLLVRELFI